MADQIAAAIRDSIAKGKLLPGTHLFEARIAREMQTSRIPVREALIQLEQEGLVTRKPSRGTFVTELTEKMMREVSSLRGLLEGYAASHAAMRLTTDDLMHLDGLVMEMRLAADAGSFLRILDCDYQFHEYVIHAAGHELLEEMWKATHAKIRVYLSATNLMYADLKLTAESHARVLEALRSGDAEVARMAMAAHTEAALEQLVTRVLAAHRKD
jgi:DNA-binding GntR family transcriptional regulator